MRQIDLALHPRTYPDAPGFEHVDTSIAAADSVEHSVEALREKVFNHIASCGQYGATSDEAEAALDMRHQTCSARFRELALDHRIVFTGEKRKTRSGRGARAFKVQP